MVQFIIYQTSAFGQATISSEVPAEAKLSGQELRGTLTMSSILS